MTRLIKLMMVATLVIVSAAQAQIFDEDYENGDYDSDVLAAVAASNGVDYVSGTGLTVSNAAAVFKYKDTKPGAPVVTNALVEFTVIPVLNDAIPTDVDGAAVVFWVGTDSNVYYLVTGGTTVSNEINVITTATDDAVAFSVTIDYVAKKFTLKANTVTIFTLAPFYDDAPTELTCLVVRETSATEGSVIELVEVQELSPTGVPTKADDAALKVYEQGGNVYVELEVATNGASTAFDVYRDGVLIGTITYVADQSVYTLEDTTAVVGQTYNYSVTDLEDGTPVGEFDVDITVLPVLEAKAFEMTQTEMTLTFASVIGETYKVVGLTALVDGTSEVVADDIVADSYETSVLVTIGDNFYFQIIKK
jgi:hypothetical protein